MDFISGIWTLLVLTAQFLYPSSSHKLVLLATAALQGPDLRFSHNRRKGGQAGSN